MKKIKLNFKQLYNYLSALDFKAPKVISLHSSNYNRGEAFYKTFCNFSNISTKKITASDFIDDYRRFKKKKIKSSFSLYIEVKYFIDILFIEDYLPLIIKKDKDKADFDTAIKLLEFPVVILGLRFPINYDEKICIFSRNSAGIQITTSKEKDNAKLIAKTESELIYSGILYVTREMYNMLLCRKMNADYLFIDAEIENAALEYKEVVRIARHILPTKSIVYRLFVCSVTLRLAVCYYMLGDSVKVQSLTGRLEGMIAYLERKIKFDCKKEYFEGYKNIVQSIKNDDFNDLDFILFTNQYSM